MTLCLCPSDNTCVQECPMGYYAEDKDERVCERCHFSCTSCTGRHSQQCVVCKPGFFKQGKSCVETCSERLEELTDIQTPPYSFLPFSLKMWRNEQNTLSFSVTLGTSRPWFANAVIPLVTSAWVMVAQTVWAVGMGTSTWGSGDSAYRAVL